MWSGGGSGGLGGLAFRLRWSGFGTPRRLHEGDGTLDGKGAGGGWSRSCEPAEEALGHGPSHPPAQVDELSQLEERIT